MFLSGLGHDTSKIVSAMLGQKTVSYSAKGIYKRNQNLQRISRNLMTPDEVRTLDEMEMLFFHSRYNPMKLDCLPYYSSKILKRRTRL
jgi:type IV secretory pathway TraG/TraD family ATPase VirD4